MKKILSAITCVVCIVLIITGICLISVGLKKGGTLNFTVDFKKHKVVPISKNVISDSFELDAFKSIEVDCAVGKVEIVEGDTFFVEYELYGDEVPSINVIDNVLKIESKGGNEIFSGIGINNSRVYVNLTGFFKMLDDKKIGIIITVPKDTKLENVSINTDCGSINLKDIICNDAILKSNVGNITFSDVALSTANITSSTGNVKMVGLDAVQVMVKSNVGNVTADDSNIEKFKASLDTGNVKIKDSLLKDVNINTDTGNVTVTMKGSTTDYDMELKTDTGNVTINGQKVSKNYSVSNQGENSFEITTDTGNIKLSFE